MRDTVTRRLWTAALCVFGLLAALPTAAQTFYKWTDDRGVVHFSDAPPADVRNVEERVVNAPPLIRRPDVQNPDTTEAAEGGEGSAKASEGAPSGPARVVLLSRQTPRISPSAIRVMGRVKNTGGEPAANVGVDVTVVDESQGTVCMQEQVDVEPSTLEPGKTGTFDLTLDNPCLFGAAELNVEPRWQ